jgi:serine O-acetyltransferase
MGVAAITMHSLPEDAMKHQNFAEHLHEHRDDARFGFQFKEGSEQFVDNLLALLFPHFSTERLSSPEQIASRLVLLGGELSRLLAPLLSDRSQDSIALAEDFMTSLPEIHEQIMMDASAINQGDPAAESLDEVILAYPGFTAIAIFRFAHEFYRRQVPIFPRLLTEYAHHLTGIDIHPGATIGAGFAIDHGTGIVVGESSIIGNHVKIYQGVTLGALSVDKRLAKSKRHPTIEDYTVIYAQAVILGGDTVVGHHSIIGGNVWLTESVPPYSFVYQEHKTRVQSQEERRPTIEYMI